MAFPICLALAWLMALPGVSAAQPAQSPIQDVIALRSAVLVERAKPAAAVELPLPVRQFRPERALGTFSATATFEAAPAPQGARWVLYAEDLRDGGTLSINGVEVGSVTTATRDTSVRHLQPFMFDIPPGVLKAGSNTVQRDWAVLENQIFLPRMLLGPKDAIRPIYEHRYFWQYTMAQVSFVFASIISLILLGLYTQNRNTPQYLWAGSSALGWGILNLAYFLTPIPAQLFGYWQFLVHCGIWAFSAGGNFFLLHDCGVDSRWYRRLCMAWGGLFVSGYLLNYWATGQTYWPGFTLAWHLGLAASGLYPVSVLVRSAWRRRRPRHLTYLLITLSGITAGALDAAAISGHGVSSSNGYMLQTVGPVWFVCICFVLIADFSRSMRLQQEQQQQLALQLQAQKVELERLHAQERAAKERQAAAQERTRIMQDMHDGLGSQLVSSLAMAQSGELSSRQTYELLRSCIDDLRLAIDTSQDSRDSLALALGNLRFRMEPRLKAAGIALRWNARELSDTLPLPPQHQLPVLRVVQESITNTLKHAQASVLTVNISSTPDALVVEIEDNGCGFDLPAARRHASGKGLNGLDKRARVLGARLDIRSSVEGTQVLLRVPLNAPGLP